MKKNNLKLNKFYTLICQFLLSHLKVKIKIGYFCKIIFKNEKGDYNTNYGRES